MTRDTMTDDTRRTDASTVARLQRAWILRWDKGPDDILPPFRDLFGDLYDFDAPVILFDDFDPQRRVFRSVQEYADAFWPTFQGFRSARHAIEVEPEVAVDGDLAVTRMVFLAVLEHADGTRVANRATNSQVWTRSPSGWVISRDHTGVAPVAPAEADAVLRAAGA